MLTSSARFRRRFDLPLRLQPGPVRVEGVRFGRSQRLHLSHGCLERDARHRRLRLRLFRGLPLYHAGIFRRRSTPRRRPERKPPFRGGGGGGFRMAFVAFCSGCVLVVRRTERQFCLSICSFKSFADGRRVGFVFQFVFLSPSLE